MSGLLEKIYREVIYYEEDAVRMEKELAVEIDGLLAPYADRISGDQMAQLKAVVYEAVFAAEAKVFWLGVRYASWLYRDNG